MPITGISKIFKLKNIRGNGELEVSEKENHKR